MSVNDGGPESVAKALRESEERCRVLLDSIDEGFCIIEALSDERGQPVDYRFLETNRAFVAQTGLVNALGRTVRELVPRLEEHWFETYGRVVLTGEPARFENEARHLNPPRFYDVYAFRYGAAEKRQVAVLFNDISPRKRAEETLRETERRYRELIRHAPVGIYEIDYRRRRFISVNDAMCEMLGYGRDELLAMDPSEMMDEEGRTCLQRRLLRWLGGEAPERNVEYRVRTKDGRTLDAVLDVSFTKGADGLPQGATVIAHDITERKKAEEALLEADRHKDEFIAILSHELRNPLAPIRYALPLLSEERLGEGGRRAVAVIDRQAAHLTRLVDDLLDVSRITAGKIELQRDRVTLAAVVAAAVEAASPAIAAGRHSLGIAVPDDPVWLDVDATRISQAITNLLNNSAKYTPQGGRIRLEATSADNVAVIRVIDNGIGISPEALPTVFEMFRQVSGANRTQGGLGVGLALTKQFVEMHGGTIEAHSAGENSGADFVIRLPLAPAAAPGAEQREPTACGQPACLRVLVVDDNVDLVDMLAMVVEAAGHDVRKAFDGRSAISAALEYQPHAILLDVGMPGMNGFEVATELRRHPEMARTRIVALTGWGQAEDRRRTAQAGFDDHLTKPTDPQQIQRILSDVAQRLTSSGSA